MTDALPSEWRELVVVLAGTSWDGIWMSEQHVAVQLSRSVPVLWVDPAVPWPVSRPQGSTRVRRADAPVRGLTRLSPTLVRLTPRTTPGVTRPVLREIAASRTRHVVARTVGTLRGRVRGVLAASPEVPQLTFPGARQVFYGTDDFVAGAQLLGLDAAWVQSRLEGHLRRADAVVAVSPVLAGTWAHVRPDILVIPNGCEAERFSEVVRGRPPADVTLPGPIAGVFGQVSDRLDLDSLEAVANRGISLLVVGPSRGLRESDRFEALVARSNVQWLGERPRDSMPGYLGAIDVGLTPYRDDSFNQASFPLKTLEYLAAGLPVVATDLPGTRSLQTDLVTAPQGPEEFAAATEAALRATPDVRDVNARREFASAHSWSRRTAELAALLGAGPVLGQLDGAVEGLRR
jgi:teichuronic acid biosynthesis glycosyltransferase TuaH